MLTPSPFFLRYVPVPGGTTTDKSCNHDQIYRCCRSTSNVVALSRAGVQNNNAFFHQEVLTKVRVEVSGGTCSKKSTVEFGLTVLLGKWVFVLFLVMLNNLITIFFVVRDLGRSEVERGRPESLSRR